MENKVQEITDKILEMVKEGFTGKVTIEYNLLHGRLMSVLMSTQTKVINNSELLQDSTNLV